MDAISLISAWLLGLSFVFVSEYVNLKTTLMVIWRGILVFCILSLFIHPFPVTNNGFILNGLISLGFAAVLFVWNYMVICIIAWIFGFKKEKITDFLAGKKED